MVAFVAKDISFRYGTRRVLDGVSLRVERGRVLGVLGPNGAGKSTLARVLLGLLPADAGEVSIDDAALASLPLAARARQVAAVLQGEHTEFAFTVRELVMFAREARRATFAAPSPADHAAVERALDAADARAFADRALAALSGGERQRALVARALAQETPYLVLDEPTAFMDLRHQHGLAALVRSLGTVGVVWILHDPDLALRYCDEVLVLEQGRVAARTLSPEVLAQVFSVRAELARDSSGAEHLLVTGAADSGMG